MICWPIGPRAIKGENTMQVESLMIHSVLSNWRLTTTRLTNFFAGLAESSFYEEIAPGRNRIIYVLGHLTAVHDLTLEVLGFGEREHPELDEVFIKNPDRVIAALPPIPNLLSFWTAVNKRLYEGMQALTPEQWVGRHHVMSEEEYVKNPGRNCLNVVLNRTNHAGYHLGQLILSRANRS
jgi:hypothetical protein